MTLIDKDAHTLQRYPFISEDAKKIKRPLKLSHLYLPIVRFLNEKIFSNK